MPPSIIPPTYVPTIWVALAAVLVAQSEDPTAVALARSILETADENNNRPVRPLPLIDRRRPQ